MKTSVTEKLRRGRSPESLEAQAFTSSCVGPLLEARGYQVLSQQTRRQALEVVAASSEGAHLKIRVRTCWTWIGTATAERKISGAQLAFGNKGGWEATFERMTKPLGAAGVTHVLIVQGADTGIELAALIPVADLYAVWQKQREVCSSEIQAGRMGRMRKNFVENGQSPTLWLKDEREPGGKAVVEALWNWPSVVPLHVALSGSPIDGRVPNDTYDDLSAADYSAFGSDGAARINVARSHVQRDDRVRREVIKRASDGCEREGCADRRAYPGFLDVHHILGVEKSDRVWNCVALCPSCHRAAHFAPDREAINSQLLEYALQFSPAKKAT